MTNPHRGHGEKHPIIVPFGTVRAKSLRALLHCPFDVRDREVSNRLTSLSI
jgi:hypothetical protein